MSTLTFDSLSFVKRLTEKGGFTQEQAEAATEALQQAFEQYSDSHLNQLATSKDAQELKLAIRELELKTETKLAETKAELIRWVVAVGLLQTSLIVAMLFKLMGSGQG